jgi:pilus assembly protein Flp/PilA
MMDSMMNAPSNIRLSGQRLLAALYGENGQDLVEYAFVIAVLALAATAGLQVVANTLSEAFNHVANSVNAYL